MIKKVLYAVVFVCLLSNVSLLHGQSSVLAIYPDPADFGIVDLNSTGYPLTIYLSNNTSSSVQVTGMTIAGTNHGDFGFYGPNCVGTILPNQFCQMAMVLTPSAMGSRAATLKIAVSGVANPISVPLTGTGGNPIPNITSLSPGSVYQGSSAIKLTITGTGFVPSSVAFWNSSALPTTFVNASQLTAQVPASDFVNQGGYSVFVSNPAPGGGNGLSATFQIVGLDPFLNSLAPSFQVSGTPASPIVINGQNFMTGATVLWNGKPLPTTYISSNQIQAQPAASQLAKANIVQLSVSNPSPGGVSQTLPFNVTYPTKVLTIDVPANDLVWDPYARRIYASLPSSYGVHGNTIAVINPFNGAVSAYHFAGSEPTKLALSADGNYLYVGLNGTGAVRRFILPSFTADINFSLDTSNSVVTATALAVSPADSHTVALIASINNCCGNNQGPVEFFHDTQLLADKVTSFNFSSLAFANSTTLFGYINSTLGEINVTATGGKLGKTWQGLVQGTDIHYEAGLIYSNQGQVFDPSSEALVGSFDLTTNGCCAPVQIVPVAPINRVFAAGVTPFSGALGITSYNLSQFTPIAVANLSQLNGSVTSTYIRWGGNGLAFTVQPNCCSGIVPQVVLVQSAAMLLASGAGSNPAPKVTSLTPSATNHGTGNFPITIQGTGFVPSSAVTFNGRQLTVDYRSATQLIVYVPGSDIATAGPANVVVTNPVPAGGTASSTFTIN